MTKVAIVGSGFIGRAWAISFARAGHDVRMWDQSPAAAGGAHDYVAGVLGDLAANDLLRGQAIDAVRGRIAVVAELEEALADAVHIQENTPESLDVKREVFSLIDALAGPQAVIASSTSALLPSKFTDHLQGRHRCLVVHPIKSALSHSGCGSRAGAMDLARNGRKDPRLTRRRRPRAAGDEARASTASS